MTHLPRVNHRPRLDAWRAGHRWLQADSRAHGFALVTCLLLLTVVAILGVAGYATALVELRIAANIDEREHAFQAAEYGIEQALQSDGLATASTYSAPQRVPADGTRSALPDPDAGQFTYRMYFAAATPSGLPAHDPGSPLTAFHFVVEATGYGARGAMDTHVQGFKVLRPAGWTGGAALEGCAPTAAECVAAPRRTAWQQTGAE